MSSWGLACFHEPPEEAFQEVIFLGRLGCELGIYKGRRKSCTQLCDYLFARTLCSVKTQLPRASTHPPFQYSRLYAF